MRKKHVWPILGLIQIGSTLNPCKNPSSVNTGANSDSADTEPWTKPCRAHTGANSDRADTEPMDKVIKGPYWDRADIEPMEKTKPI